MNNRYNTVTRKVPVIPYYYDASPQSDLFSGFMKFLAAYIYSQKLGDRLSVWDSAGFTSNVYRQHPQVLYLKEGPDSTIPAVTTEMSKSMMTTMKFADIQKIAASLFLYKADFNSAVLSILSKNGIRSVFDIGVHAIPDTSGSMIHVTDSIRAYQKKSKKTNLSVFVMARNMDDIKSFQATADVSWKLSHLLKTPPKSADEEFFIRMAEIQVMSTLHAIILDFDLSIDRYIYLMHRDVKGIDYMKTVSSTEWSLI